LTPLMSSMMLLPVAVVGNSGLMQFLGERMAQSRGDGNPNTSSHLS
jgi:hypothetical protein